MKILLVAGARPNFMKIAPIIRAIESKNDSNLKYKLVHTGQHYDFNMSETFFKDLGIPKPDYSLNAGGGLIPIRRQKEKRSDSRVVGWKGCGEDCGGNY